MSGMRHSVSTWGKGRGVARVQRLHDGSRATQSPNNISGRRAHPPKVEQIWAQKVNKKEAKLARMSALACTACAECVRARGHQFDDKVTFPVVAEDALNEVGTAAEVYYIVL
jgi:large subunit ribosomal protein L4e